MEALSRNILSQLELDEGLVGWTMVMLASAFWRDQVAATPPSRRLLLLPHCLKQADGCPAEYDELGLDCRDCGACSIADLRATAEEMGYRVLVAEGSPMVLKIIVGGHVDAIVGVACLNVLEKALDKILLAGIPCLAVPLLASDCRNTSVDVDWVEEMVSVHKSQPVAPTRTYVHLLRAASRMFAAEELDRIAPRTRGGPRLADTNGDGIGGLDPIAGTEAIAYDFLAKGGKYSRPFITLAVYDALTGGGGTGRDGDRRIAEFSDAVRRTALSIESFHKASLVHDDIEDDDLYRYGEQTLHRRYGIPTAINVGDYLIGMGYRMVSSDNGPLKADVVADILHCLAMAHTRLSEGQGAELLWRDAKDKRLPPLDALKIYALKTAPAFQAALYCGVRLAGPLDELSTPLRHFARNLGVAFQILNDLKDWRHDHDNKLATGGDILGGRPTVLWALALENLPPKQQAELMELIDDPQQGEQQRLKRVRELYCQAGVFESAHQLVDKHQQRAEAVADEIQPSELRRLLYYLIDTVLDRPADEDGDPVVPSIVSTIPPGNGSAS
jgi:geranylgeranyl pyrophosphate synthase